MIFVTVGTEVFPFDRLLKIVDEALSNGEIADTVFAQTGSSLYVPERFKYRNFMSFSQMVTLMRKSRIVIAHAGVGCTLLCLKLGRIPILVPRFKALGEHVDDHQVEFAKRLESEGTVAVAYGKGQLLNAINHYQNRLDIFGNIGLTSNRTNLFNFLKSITVGQNERLWMGSFHSAGP